MRLGSRPNALQPLAIRILDRNAITRLKLNALRLLADGLYDLLDREIMIMLSLKGLMLSVPHEAHDYHDRRDAFLAALLPLKRFGFGRRMPGRLSRTNVGQNISNPVGITISKA